MNADALKQLKDIHMPAPEAWWHLPWGVWMLIGLCCLVLLLFVLLRKPVKQRYQARKSKQARKRAIEHEIKSIEANYRQSGDALRMVAAISVLLRRVSITIFDDAHVEGLIQQEWLQFLDKQWKQTPEVSFTSEAMANLLATAAYQKSADKNIQNDAETLLKLSQRWLNEVADVAS